MARADGPSEPRSDPDWEVLAQVARGDAQAFAELVRRHQDRLLALCERLLQDREDAKDVTQEVFLRVYRKAESFKPRGQVYTWLYRIAVNQCLNQLRRRKVVRFLHLPEGEERGAPSFQPVDPGPDGAARLEIRERWQATRRALEALPPSQRTVLVLAKFEGLSYREIAAVLGITLGAVESRLFRAMRTLERRAAFPNPSARTSPGPTQEKAHER